MAQDAKDFDFGTADLEAFIANVTGLNLIYRNNMLRILKSEEIEMPRLWELFEEANNREADEGVHLMTSEFRRGFLTLYMMNAKIPNTK